MIKKEIENLIKSYSKKAAAAEANYRDTGYDRYYNALQRYEGMVSFLEASLESKERAERGDMLQHEINYMAVAIRGLRYLSAQRRDEEISGILERLENLSRR